MIKITQARLHELFDYRDDGNLIWKVCLNGDRNKIGKVAGTFSKSNKYYHCQIGGKKYRLHRLIFLYHHGYLTLGMDIDHIDGNSSNNRIENLRGVTGSQNQWNRKKSVNNTSGIKGINWDKQKSKWVSRVMVNYKSIFLGRFDTLEEATVAVENAREKYHGEFARHK
jgi:hypothetical protein